MVVSMLCNERCRASSSFVFIHKFNTLGTRKCEDSLHDNNLEFRGKSDFIRYVLFHLWREC